MAFSTVSVALLLSSASMDASTMPLERGAVRSIPPAPLLQADRAAPVSPILLAFADAVPPADLPALPPPAVASTANTPVKEDTKATVQEESEIIVSARKNVPGDPVQEINMASFAATQAIDDAVVRPVAMTYSRIVPDPIRDGIRNFLDHLTEPVVFVNFLLQHKIGKAFETLGRFALNSTIGLLGVFDIAKRKPFKLPKRPNGFADTLGFYGVKPGPFLYLPLIGPTTVRDLVGIVLNRSLLPFAFGKPFNRAVFYIPSSTLGQLDKRDQFDEEIQARKGDARGAYTATREDYLQRRQEQIDMLRGKKPAPLEASIQKDPKPVTR